MNMFNKDTSNHHIGKDDELISSLEKGFAVMFPDVKNRSIKQMTDAVDKQELDDTNIVNSIALSSNDIVNRLRHRASMMRARSKEFDELADKFANQATNTCDLVLKVGSTIREIEDILRAHAHIEPKRES